MVGRPSQRVRKRRESHPEGREGSVGPLEESGGVGRHSQRARRGRKVLAECRNELGGPPGGPESPSRKPKGVGRDRDSTQEGREDQEAFLKDREGLG